MFDPSLLCLALTSALPLQVPGTVECEAAWGPVASSVYPSVRTDAVVVEALDSGPTTPIATYSVDVLRALLPADAVALEDDAVWEIDVESVLPFLRQLHPGVTARLRHAQPARAPRAIEGGRATWIRRTEDELVLLLRVHVEFELVADSVYLLPAQFEGVLVWDVAADVPRSFHLALPPRDTNFDLNHNGSIDIGYLPLMQVATAGASRAGASADPARQRLRSSFYPSSRIEWRSLDAAIERAKVNGRRLHVLQLFGTFDDESC